jgi:type III secretion system FlhB-like substrate exporter/DNA repair exonuclease SbcCD ATPase subunit
VLLKALSLERKRFEDGMVDGANRQADTRGRLDEVANRVALLIRAANTPDQAAKDPKLAVAVKGAQAAMVELEGSSHGMAEAADTMRRAAGANDPNGARKASGMQTGAADRIAKARAALLGASDEMGKDKRADHAKTGQRQGQVQDKAKTLQTQIEKVALDIEKAHAAAAGTQPQAGDPRSAAQKVGAAAQNMADAVKDLGKPSPSGAVKNESKAIDALEEAKSKLGDLRRKVEELKTPPRRLERQQKDVKDEARQSEGDPKIKGRVRRAYQELVKTRSLADVPTADVIITNPVHLAVALMYLPGQMGAPKVVAKGAEGMAQRIKDMARAHGVPIVERRSLARAIFRSVPVGGEIPGTLYRAVAEILAYIYGLRQQRKGPEALG